MLKNEFFRTLDFMTLPPDGGVSALDGNFALYDNIDNDLRQHTDLSSDPTTLSIISSSYPYKINFVLVIACIGGTMSARLNLFKYELKKNDVLIVTPGMIGECVEFSHDCRLVMIAFQEENVITSISVPVMMEISNFLISDCKISMSDEEMDDFISIYVAMKKKISDRDYRYKRDMVAGYMQVLCCNAGQIIRSLSERKAGNAIGRRSRRLYETFISEVSKHHARHRSVAYYADRLCITPKYLSHVVLAVSGRRPVEWIRDYVMLDAKALLKSGKYTVQQVSDMLNFPNQSFFGTYFKKESGVSPKAYMSGK